MAKVGLVKVGRITLAKVVLAKVGRIRMTKVGLAKVGLVCEHQCVRTWLFFPSLWQLWKFEVEKGFHVNSS